MVGRFWNGGGGWRDGVHAAGKQDGAGGFGSSSLNFFISSQAGYLAVLR
jgi:hypothetical protein